jgi:hypothetical protein
MEFIRNPQVAYRTLTEDRLVSPTISVLGSIENFDLTQTGVFGLYTTPANKLGFALGVMVVATLVDTVTTVPQLSIGIASGETDILALEPLTNFDTLGDTWTNWVVLSKARNTAPYEIVRMNLTGATATRLLGSIYLLGFEV